MSQSAAHEFWSVFHARRVKAPDLRGPDQIVSAAVGWVQNRRRVLVRLRRQAQRIEKLEPEIHALSTAKINEEVEAGRVLARLNRLKGDALDRGMAVVREGCFRAIGKRPYPVQVMGALAMCEGYVTEMATGEGKTITASLAASIWGWGGKPVHIITVNDYLVGRDAEEMGPIYEMMGMNVGHVVHESSPQDRIEHY